MNAIETQNLTRDYNGLRAVDDVSFAVEAGEIFGFLGPNGAGKTTTIKMLTGQLRPTSGTARVMGCDVVTQRQQLKPQIGVVFEYQNIYERLSARDNLVFAARLYGVDKSRVEAVLRQVGLTGRERERTSKYSNGMKQRLLIARALLHQPRVLFLDEPTRGLDPAVAREIRAIVADLARQGTTVFLTTHYMEEADQLSRRVAIIDHGRVVALDSPGSLKASHGQRQVMLALKNGETVTLALDDEGDARRLAELSASGTVQTMRTTEATLEDVFLKLTGRSLG
ncbi:MAG: ABC transporter ATP-binding protein [Thermoflexales bacterium]|nr:ABC transporter ATP-binding protein [Thermoflexales bacterium]